MSARTDEAWEHFGRKNPYFGVLTQERFSATNLNKDTKAEFFATGAAYVRSILTVVREEFDPAYQPGRALDFGCGVARLALPLARVCSSVVGVDVSESMLAEAAVNAKAQSVENMTFVKGDDSLSRVSGTFDFIHSFIVFQHIPPQRGTAIFQRLVNLLNQDGIGVLHVTYSFARGRSSWRKVTKAVKQSLPFAVAIQNVIRGNSFREPIMQMNEYDINELLRILQEAGCHNVHLASARRAFKVTPSMASACIFASVLLTYGCTREHLTTKV